jgi:tRNA pseudouridine38-40 synthase
MRTFKLTLAYDGSGLVGWQRQPEGTSVQGVLEAALSRLEGAPVTVQGAGRTDAGVHALGQVASVRMASPHPTGTLHRALNAQLPGTIRVLAVDDAPPDFHARFSARSKTYRYLLSTAAVASPFVRSYVWHLPERLDVEAMQQAAAALVGTYDFAAFQSTGSVVGSTVRTVERSDLVVHDDTAMGRGTGGLSGPLLAYDIAGTGFLRHMVRAIVGTLVDVGRGRWPPAHVVALLGGGTRGQAGATAPAHGLFLVRVDYH